MHKGTRTGFLKYFPPPRFLTMPSVGIEVTSEAVRFIELLETSRGFRVGRFGSQSVPEALQGDDFLENKDFKALVAELKNRHKLSLISAALPEDKAYLYQLELPRLSPKELQESIELTLEEHVPIPPREAVFGYREVGETNEGRVIVGVSVMPRLVVNRYLEFFTSLDLTPVSFQIAAQCAANAVIPCGTDAPVIVVNFGGRHTGLYLASHRTVHFTSMVNVGGADLTEAIKKRFSVSTEEAEKIKTERGITRKKEDQELFFALVNTLSALKDEIDKIAAFWGSHAERYGDTRQKIQRVILCGQESGLQGLPEYLAAVLNVPTVLADVWTNALSLDSYLPPLSRTESLAYASVIGLTNLPC